MRTSTNHAVEVWHTEDRRWRLRAVFTGPVREQLQRARAEVRMVEPMGVARIVRVDRSTVYQTGQPNKALAAVRRKRR